MSNTEGLHYLTGDATEPVGEGVKILAHICNDYGGWGRGFVLALSAKSPEPEAAYRGAAHQAELVLGQVIMSGFGPDRPKTFVANMVAQRGFTTVYNQVAVDYIALRRCLDEVGREAVNLNATVHMPRIGTGLGGGDWTIVEEAILATLIDVWHVDVFVYDLPGTSQP